MSGPRGRVTSVGTPATEPMPQGQFGDSYANGRHTRPACLFDVMGFPLTHLIAQTSAGARWTCCWQASPGATHSPPRRRCLGQMGTHVGGSLPFRLAQLAALVGRKLSRALGAWCCWPATVLPMCPEVIVMASRRGADDLLPWPSENERFLGLTSRKCWGRHGHEVQANPSLGDGLGRHRPPPHRPLLAWIDFSGRTTVLLAEVTVTRQHRDLGWSIPSRLSVHICGRMGYPLDIGLSRRENIAVREHSQFDCFQILVPFKGMMT